MPYTIKTNGIEYTIDDNTIHQLERYKQYGEIPGDFLRAVLSNDFVNAVCLADSNNLRNLPALAKYLWWKMPSSSWGSAKKIMKWYSHNGINGYEKEMKCKEKTQPEK